VKRFFLMLGVVSLLIMAVAAPVASAYTKGQAEADANSYAQLHYAEATDGSCTASGKNKEGEAQYYCSGKFEFGTREWKVNVGPYGEITYHNP
jgi:hypothetical protein